MTVDTLPSCLLKFNQERTADLPAKKDPNHQLVVFDNTGSGQEQILSRENTRKLLENTEEENISRFGIPTTEAKKGYKKTDYPVLSNSIA